MKDVIHGTYRIHAGNYDWGCSIDYAILTLDRQIASIDPCCFAVKERKQVTDLSTIDYPLYTDVFPREVKAAYLCDERGDAVSGTSEFIRLELTVSPETGSPLVFTSRSQIFRWSDPYELLISYKGEMSLQIDPVYTEKCTDADVFLKSEYVTSDGTVYPCAEYIPSSPADTLFVWLHGLGEGQIEGSDCYLPLLGHKGTVFAGDAFQKALGGAYVLVPQCPTYWMDSDGKRGNLICDEEKKTVSLDADGTSYYTDSLDELIDMYAEKTGVKRIAIGGCSNGGYMSLMLTMKNPGKYCAVVPVCEPVPDRKIPNEKIETLAKESLFFIYAEDDPIVPPEVHEIPTIQRLREAGARDLHVFHPAQVIDTSGLVKQEDGRPYRYMGHLSWIYFDNNDARDEEGLSVWKWLGSKTLPY